MAKASRRARKGSGGNSKGQGQGKSAGAGIEVPERMYRGFGPDPTLVNDGTPNMAIKRTDTLEVPAVVASNPLAKVQGGNYPLLAKDGGGPDLDTLEVAEEVTVETTANLLLQYIASLPPRVGMQFGAPYGLTQGAGIHVYPVYTDDLERDFGFDIYIKMMFDAVVKAKIETMKDGILDKPYQISPGCEAEKDDDSAAQKKIRKFATEVSDFVKANFDQLPQGFMIILREILDGIPLGYKLAEQVYERRQVVAGKKVQTALASLNPKPQEAVSIVGDLFNTVLGYIPRLRGSGLMGSFLFGDLGVMQTQEDGSSTLDIPEMIPPEKIAHFKWMARDDSPVGTSHLRAAYIPWRLKIGLWPAYEAYLARFASPSAALELQGQDVLAIASEAGQTTDPIKIVTLLLNNLRAFQSGGAMVVPFGSVKLLQAVGNGQAFLSAFELVDNQITTSILHTNLSTDVGKFGTKGLGEVHQDTGNLLYQVGKVVLANFIREEIIRPLVYYNFGEAGLQVLPYVTFGETQETDLATIGGMFASLKGSELLFPPQYNDAFKQLHIKELPQEFIDLLTEIWLKGLEAQQQQLEMAAIAGQPGMVGPNGQPMQGGQPGGGQPPGGPGAQPGGSQRPGGGSAGVGAQAQAKTGATGQQDANQNYYT